MFPVWRTGYGLFGVVHTDIIIKFVSETEERTMGSNPNTNLPGQNFLSGLLLDIYNIIRPI